MIQSSSLPLYNHFFNPELPEEQSVKDWSYLASEDIYTLPVEEPDFVMGEAVDVSWASTAKKVATLLAKIIIFPWGIYSLLQYALKSLVLRAFYPKAFYKPSRDGEDYSLGFYLRQSPNLHRENIIRHICLKKDGVNYSGLLMGNPNTLSKRKWVVFCPGNGTTIQDTLARDPFSLDTLYEKINRAGYNLLMVNGPGVEKSEGRPDIKTMVDPQEAALHFAREVLEADEIVPAGHSMGGALIGRAVTRYLENYPEDHRISFVFRSMTFSSMSLVGKEVAKKFVPSFLASLVPPIVKWVGMELNEVDDSKILSEKGIREVILQAGTPSGSEPSKEDIEDDNVISKTASLAQAVFKEEPTPPNKELKLLTHPMIWIDGVPVHNHNSGIMHDSFERVIESEMAE